MVRKLTKVVTLLVILGLTFNVTYGQAAVFDNKISEKAIEVSPQVTHIQESYHSNSISEAVNILDINLNHTYTRLEVGIPNPLNSLKKTTALAKANSSEGHRVVGAVNASYFLGNGSPANLLAANNQIINYGVLGEGTESPTQQPVAFGISKNGKAIADYYTTNLSFSVNGERFSIDRINGDRSTNKTVLYTAGRNTTGTNEWGTEIVVTNSSQNMKELHFGDNFSGVISSVTPFGQPGNSVIPEGGFVISIQNQELATRLSTLAPGTPIDVQLSIDEQWMDAQFILAAGPLLVKDGQVNVSMPLTSSFANTRSPRTAVAVDSTGTRVFLVTVDGRQSGYSNGTNLKDLASYLISKGASAAINLDGGGSTTMAVRNPGGYYPFLVNRPSDGYERSVSAILQVVNTAPQGKLKSISLGSMPTLVTKDTSFTVEISSAYDEYLNPFPIDPSKVKWTVEGNIGTVVGQTFTSTAEGNGKIVAEYEGIRAETNVSVLDIGDEPLLLDSLDNSALWTSETAKAKASIANASKAEPFRQGTSSLKLTYDFTTAETGTKAAYAVAKQPLSILGQPKTIGAWVYGDGGKHWLRGVLVDGTGTKHTLDFTSQGGLDWTGWKYVKATVPANLELPLKFERIYITEPTASLQNKGHIYIDQLQAVYLDNHVENIYTDLDKGHWAFSPVEKLNTLGLIKGHIDGTFLPENVITRAEAASIIARALDLKATANPNFTDVRSTHYAYNDIAAVAEKGIITGREKGKFTPDGKLTRAEMATILIRAYGLTGEAAVPFKDINSKHWAYKYIQTLVANNLAGGLPGNTFGPDQQITRSQFAAFLERAL